jgi:hypothetical protein
LTPCARPTAASTGAMAAPQVDTSAIDALIAKLVQARGHLAALQAGGGRALALQGALHDGPEAR